MKSERSWGRLGMKYKTYTMEDALDAIIDYRGKTPKKSESGIPTLSAKTVRNNFIDYNNCYYISEEEYKRFMVRGFPKVGDILLTTEAPLGMTAKLNRADVAIAQRLLTLRGKADILDNDYLLYFLQSPKGQHLLKSHETGTTVTGIKQAVFRKLEISIPSITVQKQIAMVLSSIDEKISVNTKINENLEQQAQAIYTEMFIDNALEAWQTGTLSDIAAITMGQSPKGDTLNDTGKGDVFYQGRTDFGFRFPTRRLYTTEPKRIALYGDALMSVRAPVGDLNVAYEECCIGRGLAAIHSRDNHQSFVLYTLFALKRHLDVFNGEGTVFGSINKDSLNSIGITIPPIELVDKFESIVNPIDRAILNNYEEICRLQSIRDSLLPKLMNGEIDVSQVKI